MSLHYQGILYTLVPRNDCICTRYFRRFQVSPFFIYGPLDRDLQRVKSVTLVQVSVSPHFVVPPGIELLCFHLVRGTFTTPVKGLLVSPFQISPLVIVEYTLCPTLGVNDKYMSLVILLRKFTHHEL